MRKRLLENGNNKKTESKIRLLINHCSFKCLVGNFKKNILLPNKFFFLIKKILNFKIFFY